MYAFIKITFIFLTGVLVERLMECPLCRELSFLGEWMTPKETQGMETRPCEECMQEVDTAFLVQPREKKRGRGFFIDRSETFS